MVNPPGPLILSGSKVDLLSLFLVLLVIEDREGEGGVIPGPMRLEEDELLLKALGVLEKHLVRRGVCMAS